MECGYNHYKRLMAQFGVVVNVFLALPPPHQAVIADITRRMGYGMAEFIEKEVGKELGRGGAAQLPRGTAAGRVGAGCGRRRRGRGAARDLQVDCGWEGSDGQGKTCVSTCARNTHTLQTPRW